MSIKHALMIIAVMVGCGSAAPADHQIDSLKGYYDFSQEFKMYSGYLPLQETPTIKAHYLFVTSKANSSSDDLVLWMNGGPGCSSLIGFLQELGPHVIHMGSESLAKSSNPFSWNNNANILFLETPPGVGFSINEDPNYQYNDTRTASDNLLALKEWFKLYPQFAGNKFWLSGESYCGMYTPLFAQQILQNKDSIIDGGSLNFQGILIGNAVMQTELHWRRRARNAFFSRHYFYGPEIQALIKHCGYNSSDDINPLCRLGNKLADESTLRINPYNSIGICYLRPEGSRRYWYSAFDQELYNMPENQPGCSSDHEGLTQYFNDDEVQTQLKVVKKKWEACSSHVGNVYRKDVSTVNLFQGFKEAGLKVLLYSGNIDAQVSYIETQEYIRQMGRKVIQPKRSILNQRGSLEGWVTVYDGLTFYVINGAGHMVPHDKPHAAVRMFQSFRAGKL